MSNHPATFATTGYNPIRRSPLSTAVPAREVAGDFLTEDSQGDYLTTQRVHHTESLPVPVLPMPSLHPHEALAFYLENPLLLAKEPRRLAATRAAYEAGEYDQARVYTVARLLQTKRDRINNSLAVEPTDHEAEAELLDLCAHPALAAERTYLRRRVFGARPSEYGWLRARLEAAIIRARS